MFICVIFGLISLQCVSSYKIFQSSIPNGAAVPFPCKSGQIWQGVGHLLDEGTGTRNSFGLDFEAEGNTWTEKLCRKDSDGDGLTNGDELGDPDCKWKPNSAPPNRTTQITHPGICDSWDSPDCMKKPLNGSRYQTQQLWLAEMCKSDGLNCPAMNETGVQRVELRLPAGSRIPPKETTYQCMMFDLYAQGVPQDKELHMVAVTPIIDNRNVLHHAVLFGCTNDTEVKNVSQECGMLASPSCSEFLHVWTVGLDGECYHPEAGIKIGLKGYRIVAIQLHWNNPSMRADYTDTSGLLVYYTPKLRRYNAGVLMVGSANFYLSPKKEEILIQGKCSGACTNSSMNGTIYVTSAWNHMHYAGNKMNIQLVRPDNSTRYLTNERVYSYDSPQVELFTTGLEIHPGDSLISNCGYQTMNRNKTTFWGEATKEEMCFGFLTYYPRENMRQRYCVDFQGVSQCDRASFEGCVSVAQFLMAINTTAVYRDVASNCRSFFPCIDECVETIVHYMRTEKCMQGNIWNYIQDELARGNDVAREFLSRLYSCKTEVYMALNSTQNLALNSTQNLALNSTKLTQTGCEPDAALKPTSGILTVLIVVLAVLTTMMY